MLHIGENSDHPKTADVLGTQIQKDQEIASFIPSAAEQFHFTTHMPSVGQLTEAMCTAAQLIFSFMVLVPFTTLIELPLLLAIPTHCFFSE